MGGFRLAGTRLRKPFAGCQCNLDVGALAVWKTAGNQPGATPPETAFTKSSASAGAAEFTTNTFRQIPHRSISKIPDIPPERFSCGDVLPAG